MVLVGEYHGRMKNAKDRLAGIKDAIKGSKIEIVERPDGPSTPDRGLSAKANVQDTLVK